MFQVPRCSVRFSSPGSQALLHCGDADPAWVQIETDGGRRHPQRRALALLMAQEVLGIYGDVELAGLDITNHSSPGASNCEPRTALRAMAPAFRRITPVWVAYQIGICQSR